MSGRSGEAVELRRLRAAEVPALIACVRRCYGESYPEQDFYEADVIKRELDAGRLLGAVGLVGGRLVAHLGLRIPMPGDAVGDTVVGIVDPDYRGLGLMSRVGGRMVADLGEFGIVATRHFATAAHDRTQRQIVAGGATATGVLLGHIPAETDYRGMDLAAGTARIAAVAYFQSYGRLGALDVHLPDRFAEVAKEIYEQSGLERRLVPRHRVGSASERSDIAWTGSLHHDARRGISTLRFGSLAHSALRPAADLVDEVLRDRHAIVYADVPVADRRAPDLLALLHECGFIFGALLPGTAASEAVRVQRLAGASIAPRSAVTASPAGSALLAWIAGEYERTVV
jgi:hypothetical protein